MTHEQQQAAPAAEGRQVVLVEDEQSVRRAMAQTLELDGYTVHACDSAEQARPWLRRDFDGVVVSDVRLPQQSGLALLLQAMQCDADLPVVLVTGHGDVDMAVEAMRAGAYDFIEKPFAAERLLDSVRRADEKRRLVIENRRLRQLVAGQADTPLLVGRSAAIERVRALIDSVAASAVNVLIHGQTGTGKEVVARHLHLASGRRGPFVAINCGALAEGVFDSELFGHEAGAFTGALKRRIGKLEYAAGGTLFLDEIESMPLALQVKLLRVLQERSLERVGGNASIAIDCRVLAATKVDLLALAARGGFREDLYYRLGVVELALPSLAQRRDDIPLLLAFFAQTAAALYQRQPPVWSAAQMAAWQARAWPGNVRELRNFADRLVLGLESASAGAADGTGLAGAGAGALSLPQQLEQVERRLIEDALEAAGGTVAQAAEYLGVPKKTLYDKLRKHHLGGAREAAE